MSDNGRKIFNIIISIIIAFSSWTYVVYNNDPTTEVKYKDIPITFVGEDALANRGLGVSQISNDSIDITLKQKRIATNEISAEDITILADVSDAAEGENGISLQISGPTDTQVAEAERRSISVEVEESSSVEEKIIVEYEEDYEGLEPVTSNLTSTQATVIGAKSEVSRVDKVAARIALDESNNNAWKYTAELIAVDSEGDEIEHVVLYPGKINFRAYAGVTKEVPLKAVVEKSADDGYTRTYSVPETIVIKGPVKALNKIEKVSTETINLNYIYEDTEVELTYDLPDGVYVSNQSDGLVMNVKVTENQEEESDE